MLGHLTRKRRHALCLLLACVLGSAPVLSCVAQTHESAHLSLQDAHFHSAPSHADGHHDGNDSDHAGDLVHGIAHAAHGCAHVLAIPSDLPVLVPTQSRLSRLPDCIATRGDALIADPFRPPIAF
jgi:hypothetical protein